MGAGGVCSVEDILLCTRGGVVLSGCLERGVVDFPSTKGGVSIYLWLEVRRVRLVCTTIWGG